MSPGRFWFHTLITYHVSVDFFNPIIGSPESGQWIAESNSAYTTKKKNHKNIPQLIATERSDKWSFFWIGWKEMLKSGTICSIWIGEAGRPHLPLGCTGSLLLSCWAAPATRPGPAPLRPVSKQSWTLFQIQFVSQATLVDQESSATPMAEVE